MDKLNYPAKQNAVQEKINEVIDKALITKDNVGTDSFIDTKAGTTTYPTSGANLNNSLVIGNGAYFTGTSSSYQGVTLIGKNAKGDASYQTVVGRDAYCSNTHSTSIGYNTGAATYATALGAGARASNTGSVAVGYGASAPTQYAIAVGYGSSTGGSSYNVAIGTSSSASAQYATVVGASSSSSAVRGTVLGYGSSATQQWAVAIGSGAIASSQYSIQLGQGTNTNAGSLQFKDYPLVNSNGKIYEERIPEGIDITGTNPPNLYDWDTYQDNDDKVDQGIYLWTGETNSVFTKDQFYKGVVNYSKPSAKCSWISSNYVTSQKDVIIDQDKLYQKLAEISQDRIDNSDTENSIVGGDNSNQDMYFYYNGAEQQWYIEFSNSALESGDNDSPDDYYFASGETLADFGIYINESALNLPTDDSDEEIFDIEYYAPNYCDSFSTNEYGGLTINYMKFMSAMCDDDWGFGYIIPDMEEWEYEVGSTTYVMPIVPKTYTFDSSDYEDITVRFEYDTEYEGNWAEYINGEHLSYEWTTANLLSTFGIDITASASDVEYIEITFRPARQCNWEQFNPIDETKFAKQEDLSALETAVQPLLDWKVNVQTGNVYNLNNFTTPGWYYFPNATSVTNRPSTVGIGFMLLVQKNSNNIISQHLFACVPTNTVSGTNYGYETPMVYSRIFAYNSWFQWQSYLTNGNTANLVTGYDITKKQYLVHDTDANKLKWEEGSDGGGSATYDSTNERITWS